MRFINEDEIEKVIEGYYDSETKFFGDRDALTKGQPSYTALITDEGFEMLTDDEYELLWFISTVIYTTITENIEEPKTITQKLMEESEEGNWSIMEENTASSFRDRLTPFFKDYPQEDLLAFVEDSLESDEDISVSPVAREMIFVACKSLIDCIHKTMTSN